MLFEICTVVLCFMVPIAGYFGFSQGIKYRPTEEKPLKTQKRASKKKVTVDEKFMQILANIDNYDGTSAGQEKI